MELSSLYYPFLHPLLAFQFSGKEALFTKRFRLGTPSYLPHHPSCNICGKIFLALSLGLVGALSIVRFRTPIKEPEELAYIFLAIAIGLALGADQKRSGHPVSRDHFSGYLYCGQDKTQVHYERCQLNAKH